MKSSGLGRRHGREGLLKYTEAQTITVAAPRRRSRRSAGCPTRRTRRVLTAALRVMKAVGLR